MEDVITISSSSDQDDSDVEIIGCFSNVVTCTDPLPLASVRVNVPPSYIKLSDSGWSFPELTVQKRLIANGTEPKTEKFPEDDCQINTGSTDKTQALNTQDFKFLKSSSRDPPVFALQQDSGNLKPKRSRLDSQTQHQKQTDKVHHHTPTVKLRRLPFLETHVTELKTLRCSVYLTKDCTQMSLQPGQLDSNSDALECISALRTTTASNGPHREASLDESSPMAIEYLCRQEEQVNSDELPSTQLHRKTCLHLRIPADSPCSDERSSVATSVEHITREDERDGFGSSMIIPSPISPSSSQDKAQKEVFCSKLEQLEFDQADLRQSCLSDHSSLDSPAIGLNASEPFDLDSLSHTRPTSHNLMRQLDPTPPSENTPAEWQSEVVKANEASDSSDHLHCSVPGECPLSVCKSEDLDDESWTGIYGGDLGVDSQVSVLWQEGRDGEEDRFDVDFRLASREDRHSVCPVTLRKIMSGPAQALIDEHGEDFGTPEVLCRQSLNLVYSTIDVNYPEGTLELLSDLIQPGYYPPRDITLHLLSGILLDPQCPYHLCVQAFNLLTRTQRHHIADKTTVPWDWELLTSVMANQDNTKRHRCEVVRMLLEYVVQTLEDDFRAKRSASALHHSIAKATLSCDLQFPRVRDVMKWLFSAIMKSTEPRESNEAAKERDEQIRMVSILQRMLSLAVEVDRTPALNSAKLSQELFHMVISNIRLRAHRMLLLESLQSKLLRCKLLEHLLDYACPQKISLPMSLSLLLHFMKNCTLAPDPMDGAERWQRWEELVHLLWMLLLSYNKAMKGYLYSSITEQRGGGPLVYKRDDMLSKPTVCEAVEAFLSRSQADLGQPLPIHVEESLTYLQDHLLDVCQC
ncbi:uncharacterized protein simc1 [Chaetodon trifascialis]|uniref:uncharacterized protein simc1 n=1 Tax=Chaetodon trifascialis TaxID=109706 RepID=UPI0039951D0F